MGQLLARLFVLSGLVVGAGAVAGGLAYAHLQDQRQQSLDRIDPALSLVNEELAAYRDEEIGVQGYALTGQSLFLALDRSGQAAISGEDRRLSALLPASSPAGKLLAGVNQRAAEWGDQFAAPSVTATASGDHSFDTPAELARGKALFNQLRQAVNALSAELTRERNAAKADLKNAISDLGILLLVVLGVVAATGVAVWAALHRVVLRSLAAVAEDARRVAAGDLTHSLGRPGPAEVADLAAAIEAMRLRILEEVHVARRTQEELAAANAELQRSNEDLEQFAYVASHDLQEPLRKVASFCQLLEQRYSDQLDERGLQYVAFAVDGAKRMQVLISDLLAFSRIGRTTERFVEVALGDAVGRAVANLSSVLDDSGSEITVEGDLPRVLGDPTLLTTLFQNLIGNAVKFRGEDPPRVRLEARAEGDRWLLSVSDNGIGIEPRFAERVFVIFQRLHGRDAYPGTGIGLALCRKIVEFHGGQIWLDTGYGPGSRLCFTLPQIPAEETPTDDPDPDVPHREPPPPDDRPG
jgi:signal transduction histidine kinase